MALPSLARRALASGLEQPSQTTCGSCVLVVSRLLHDPPFAELVVEGTDPETGEPEAGEQSPGSLRDRFTAQALAVHRSTNALRGSDGRLQIPWPRSLGTQPWALAREMSTRCGERGRTYDVQPVRPSRRTATFGRLVELVAADHAVPLYVGNRWSPRHVVLVLPDDDATGDEVRIYDPASGRSYGIEGDDFASGSLRVAGWEIPWVVVAPE